MRRITIIIVAVILSALSGYRIAHSAPAMPRYLQFVPLASMGHAAPLCPLPPSISACKAGAGWPKEDTHDTAPEIRALGVCRVFDWGASVDKAHKAHAAGMMYYPMVWGCRVNRDRVAQFAAQFPGSTWLLLNEPGDPYQANCTPTQAAEALHDLRHTLSLADMGDWKIYGFGTVYDRHAQFLRDTRNAYVGMYHQEIPLDGVHLHLYRPFNDRFDYAALEDELTRFRRWQQAQSWLRDKPIIVSEFGVLSASWYPQDVHTITNEFIPHMLPWLNRQDYVEAHLWFSTYYSDTMFQPSNLLDARGRPTNTGRTWQAWHGR